MQKEVVVVKDSAEYMEWVRKQTPIYVAPTAAADSTAAPKADDKDKKVMSELVGGTKNKSLK
jgi:hypothetical protein